MPLDAGMLCHARRGVETVRLTKSMCIDEMSRKCNKLQAMHPPSPLAHFPFSSLFIYFFELSHTIYLFRLQLGMDSLGNSSINHTEYAKESRKALHAVPSCAYVCMCVFINEGRKIKIPAAIFRSQCHYSCNVFDRRTDGQTGECRWRNIEYRNEGRGAHQSKGGAGKVEWRLVGVTLALSGRWCATHWGRKGNKQ